MPNVDPTGSGQRESKGLERAEGRCVSQTKTKDGRGAFGEVVEEGRLEEQRGSWAWARLDSARPSWTVR